MDNKNISKEEGNRKEVLSILGKSEIGIGLTITGLVRKTSLSRAQIRTAISFLLGSKEIEEVVVGMAKVYNLI